MTSQIAISNQTGVVIASDTVTSLTNRGLIQKTINDQQKIWPLWPNNTIAILTSGCATINGIQNSTLITEWKKNNKKIYTSVQECATDFNSWLGERQQPFTVDSEQKVILELIANHIERLQHKIVENLKDAELYFADPEFEEQAKSIIDNSIAESMEALEVLPTYSTVNLDVSKKNLATLKSDINEIIDETMWDCTPDAKSRKVIHQSLPLLLCRIQQIDNLDSMFGFVGFGSKEIFTAISRVSIRGFYCASLQSECTSDDAYDVSGPGEISLFAQTDAIRAFTDGLHMDVLDRMSDFMIDKFSEHIDDVEKLVDATIEVIDLIKDYSIENFTSPLLATIGNLNLNDLAKLADSLIGMQSIKSAASPHPASVGGLIEILLIDREHGFRWFRKLPARTSPIPVLN